MSARGFLFIVLVLIPLLMQLGTRLLVARGDTDPQRRAVALEYFTEDDIARGREYYRAFQPGGALANLIYWGFLAWMVFGGAGRYLADAAARHRRGGLILEVIMVGLPLFLFLRLALLPITYYHSFVLEGDFGFRRLDFAPWLVRVLKGWGVTALTQLLVGIAFFWAVRRFGKRWLWPVLVGGTGLSIVFIVAWPLLVLPLFYTITPLPGGELHDGVTELAERAGVTIDDIRMIDQSRVSGHTNAFFVGFGDRRSIYLYDTLAEDHSNREILSVVAHEMGHWHYRHMLRGWALGIAASALGLLLLRWFLRLDVVHRVFRIRGAGDVAIIPLLWLLLAAVSIYTAPVENALSRWMERESDRFALELTEDPETFIAMKVNSTRENRRDLLPHPWVTFWYSTHPPVLDRILAAEAWKRRHF